MKSEYFKLLDVRDFANSAVRDEIYRALKEKERMEVIFRNMGIDYKQIGGKAPKYETPKY